MQPVWEAHNNGERQSSLATLASMFQKLAADAGVIWIVLDALDECTTRTGDHDVGLLHWLEHLYMGIEEVHMIVTSRPESDINLSLRDWTSPNAVLPITGVGVDHDIQAYINTSLVEHPALWRWRAWPKIQEEIRLALSQKAHGM